MKKFLSILCIFVCLLGLTACEDVKPVAPEDNELVQEYSEFILDYILAEDPQAYMAIFKGEEIGLDAFTNGGAEYTEYIFENIGLEVDGYGFIGGIDSWNKAVDEIGGFVSAGNNVTVAYSTKGDTLVVDVPATFENRTATVEFVYKDNLRKTLTSFAVNVDYTFGEKMSKAGLNTLLGMGTVFIVLILLSFLIGCFKFINNAEQAIKNKDQTEVTATAAPVVAQPVVEDVSDDSELVAVISAAIAAFEAQNGGSADGYVVRSIRRRTNNKWNKN